MAKGKTKKNTEVEVKTTGQLNKKSLPAGKILSGVVVSDKMKDTCVVSVTRFVKHLKYKKYYKVSKKYKVHDVGNTKKIGDKAEIKESRPISKDKHFVVVK
jgi:small subunit ribosomal protein S17